MDEIVSDKRISHIQILRGIGAIFVVFYHINFIGLSFGLFGVDIFFILSGFIVAKLVEEKEKYFLLKRVVKIVPPYYFATLAIILFLKLYPSLNTHIVLSFETIVKSILFIPYHINTSGPILSIGWTLNIEMLYYLLVGIGLMIFKFDQYKWYLFIGFFLTLFVSKFYIEILMGNGLYLYFNYNRGLKFHWANLVTIVIVLFFLSILVFLDFNNFYFHRPIIWGTISLFFIFFFLQLDLKYFGEIFRTMMIKIGDASYVIYLIHPFVIKMILIFFIFFYKEQKSNIFLAIFEMIVTLGVGYMIHIKVEKPFNLFLRSKLIIK